MKPIETAQHNAIQAPNQRFQASYQEAWGIWTRLMQEEFLVAAFSRREDADAYASKHARGGQRGEIRKMWVLLNESTGEAYALSSNSAKPLQGIDLDFGRRLKMNSLRSEVLSRLSDEELAALGLKRP